MSRCTPHNDNNKADESVELRKKINALEEKLEASTYLLEQFRDRNQLLGEQNNSLRKDNKLLKKRWLEHRKPNSDKNLNDLSSDNTSSTSDPSFYVMG